MSARVALGGPITGGGRLQHSDSQGLLSSDTIKTGACIFIEVNGISNSSSVRYFHVYDSEYVPEDGEIPAFVPVLVPPYGVFSLSFVHGYSLRKGLSWSSSTTLATKTQSEEADIWASITFK